MYGLDFYPGQVTRRFVSEQVYILRLKITVGLKAQ